VSAFAAIDAHADFRRARRRHLAVRAWRRITGHGRGPSRPRSLDDVATLFRRPARLRPIPLQEIVGTVDATTDFDADFRPATDRISSRWQRIARVNRDGRPLPPITVIERPDGYYVVDGRHRVSVARALSHEDIDAWTTPTARQASAPQPSTNHERARTRGVASSRANRTGAQLAHSRTSGSPSILG
jgi:hypothetical protein